MVSGCRPFSRCTLTEDGLIHMTPLGRRLAMSLMPTSPAAATKMGSIERSFTRLQRIPVKSVVGYAQRHYQKVLFHLRYPLPRSGSLGYQWPVHLRVRPERTPVSKPCISDTARSSCFIIEHHQLAACLTSSEKSIAHLDDDDSPQTGFEADGMMVTDVVGQPEHAPMCGGMVFFHSSSVLFVVRPFR